MTLSKSAKRNAAEERVHAITDCATRLHTLLTDRSSVPLSLRHEVEAHIGNICGSDKTVFTPQVRALDMLGTNLWNAAAACSEQDRQPAPDIQGRESASSGLQARVFALVLLDLAYSSSARRVDNPSQRIRVLKTALNSARACLKGNDLDHANTSIEICSQYVNDDAPEPFMQICPPECEDDNDPVVIIKLLTAKYQMLRLLHAWKSDRLDLAEHFYMKLSKSDQMSDAGLAIEAADMLYELAISLIRERKSDLAVQWLDRSFVLVNNRNIESLSQDAVELLLSVGVALTDQLIATNISSNYARASEIVGHLEKSHGVRNRIAVPLIKFRLLACNHELNNDEICRTLLRLSKLIVLTEDSFKLMMQTIKKAADLCLVVALDVLKTFVRTRIMPEIKSSVPVHGKAHIWLEKSIVSYLLFSTSKPDFSGEHMMEDLSQFLDEVSAGGGTRFSTEATHASQTLMWKASGCFYGEDAMAWMRLLRHPLFENAGLLNKARICRKLMRVALEEGKTIVARETYTQLPPILQNDPLTRFLAFKLALRIGDNNLALESLKVVMKVSSKDPTFLYACVLEAQQSNSRQMAVAALQGILDERPTGTNLPSLLRCIARLLIGEFDSESGDPNELLVKVLQVCETTTSLIEDIDRSLGDQSRLEMQWWSKNTYNLAIRLSAIVKPELLVRLLDVCSTFLDHCPNGPISKGQEQIDQRKMLCAFLSTTALIVLGRSDTDEEHSLQCYLHAKERIAIFKQIMKKSGEHQYDDLMEARAFSVLKFDLECVLRLEQWECLGDTIEAFLERQTITNRWDALADLLIIVHRQLDDAAKNSHSNMMILLLQRIINDTWKKEKDITKVARWLRFTFVLCLDHSQATFSLKLLEQAASMAENGERGKYARYPESELQWLATMSFNHAIDLLINDEEAAALSWMTGALDLARWSHDNGSLHACLTNKKEMALERVRTQ